MTDYAPLTLHVPEPAVRPGGTPDFSSVGVPRAGSVARPEVNADPESIRDLAYSIIRVLNRDGKAIGPWGGLLSDEELLEGLRHMMILRTFDARMLMAQRQGKTSFYMQHMGEEAVSVYGGKFNAPMLWNSNFFMTLESMKILRVLADVWLPDFKFGPGRCAMALAKTPWYWETVTRNLKLIAEWGEDFSIRHLVMPNHVECCTYPVLEWIAEHVPAAPVNVMAQFHPDNFCDPASAKYRDKYAEIARRPSSTELNNSWHRARELGLKFETTSFERCDTV